MKSPAPSADSVARTHRLYRRLALAAALLTLVVIAASAFIRHTQAGLSCIDWPACYAQLGGRADIAAPAKGVSIARLLHRFAATTALVLVIGLWLSARGRGPGFSRERALALAALLVAAALGVLGVATPSSNVPAVPLGNLLGGYLMLAMLAALIAVTGDSDDRAQATRGLPRSRRRFALGMLAVAFVQASLGALIGTRFALTACTELLRCTGFVAAEFTVATLDPFQPVVIADGHVVAPAGAAGLHIAHRMLGITVAMLALGLAYASRSMNRRAALLLMVAALATPLLGATAIVAMPSLALTVLHNMSAAVLIALLAYVASTRTAG